MLVSHSSIQMKGRLLCHPEHIVLLHLRLSPVDLAKNHLPVLIDNLNVSVVHDKNGYFPQLPLSPYRVVDQVHLLLPVFLLQRHGSSQVHSHPISQYRYVMLHHPVP
ncbi:hypothetical protein D9M71_720390 [compost metagenome]